MDTLKKTISLAGIALLTIFHSTACNMCGCGTSVFYTGLLNYSGTNFISLQGTYSGLHTLDEFTSSDINSYYLSTMLTGSMQIIRGKWDAQMYLPYMFNSYHVADTDPFNINGLGDMGILNHITVLHSNDSSKATWNLAVKAGLELPTGNFNQDYREEDVPPALSAGSGSWDVITGLRFSYFKNKFGIYGDYMFKLNTQNNSNYKFGNQNISNVIVSYRIPAGRSTITPLIGILSEFIDYDTFYGYDQHGTSGVNVYGIGGLDFNTGRFNTGCNINLPVHSRYDNNASSVIRGSVHVGYVF